MSHADLLYVYIHGVRCMRWKPVLSGVYAYLVVCKTLKLLTGHFPQFFSRDFGRDSGLSRGPAPVINFVNPAPAPHTSTAQKRFFIKVLCRLSRSRAHGRTCKSNSRTNESRAKHMSRSRTSASRRIIPDSPSPLNFNLE